MLLGKSGGYNAIPIIGICISYFDPLKKDSNICGYKQSSRNILCITTNNLGW